MKKKVLNILLKIKNIHNLLIFHNKCWMNVIVGSHTINKKICKIFIKCEEFDLQRGTFVFDILIS